MNVEPSKIEKVNLPLIRDYEIVFHEQEVYKLSLNADFAGL